MVSPQPIFARLDERRRELGISCAVLAERTALSLRTVQRVLTGDEADPGFDTVLRIAAALGVALTLEARDINDVRKQQAEQKAERLVNLVQGTSALEAQAISPQAIRAFKERTVRDLLAGSARKLWAQ